MESCAKAGWTRGEERAQATISMSRSLSVLWTTHQGTTFAVGTTRHIVCFATTGHLYDIFGQI